MADPDYIPEEEEEGRVREEGGVREEGRVREDGRVREEGRVREDGRVREEEEAVVEVHVPEGELGEQEQGGRLTHRLPPPHPPCA